MLVRQLLDQLAADLNDFEPRHEYTRYTQAQLLVYLNEAFCVVYTYRSEWFAKTQVIALVEGAEQQVDACCAKVQEVLEQTDACGLAIRHLTRKTPTTAYRWTKPSCLNRGACAISSYWTHPTLEGTFFVDPPVPKACAIFVKAICASPPDALTLDTEVDADCRQITAARQWVLGRALAVDTESAHQVALSQQHTAMFWNLLGVQLKMEERFKNDRLPPRGSS